MFRRYGEFVLNGEYWLPGQEFTRWMFRSNETLPGVRILRLMDVNNERLPNISKCTKLKLLQINIVGRNDDVFDALPPFPSSLQELKVDITNYNDEELSEDMDQLLKRAFLVRPFEYSQLVTVRWWVHALVSVPPKDFISWISFVPALKTLVMTVDWATTGVLPAICEAKLGQLSKLHLSDCREVPENGQTFQNEDEIDALFSKLPRLDLLILERDRQDGTIDWKFEKMGEKCKFEHTHGVFEDEAAYMQLFKDQVAFLRRPNIHWSEIHLTIVQPLVNDFLLKVGQVCSGYEQKIDKLWLIVDGDEDDEHDRPDFYTRVFQFMETINCPLLTMQNDSFESWTFHMLDKEHKKIGVTLLDGPSPIRILRSLGYNIQMLSVMSNEDNDFRYILSELQNQNPPLEEFQATTKYLEGALYSLAVFGLDKKIKQLSLRYFDATRVGVFQDEMIHNFPSLVLLYIQFSNPKENEKVRKFVESAPLWMNRYATWRLQDSEGIVLAQSVPTETKTLLKKEGTSGGSWMKHLANAPIEQVYEEFYQEKIDAEIQSDVAKQFPRLLTFEERQFAFELAQTL